MPSGTAGTPREVRHVAGHVIGLAEASGCSAAEIGGKAMGLTRLLAHGFPVPEGVVITTDVFAAIASAAGLLGPIADLDKTALDERCERAASTLLSAALPPDLELDVREVLGSLLASGSAVAVRSSATLEDSATASFSGMLVTITDVTSADHAVAAIRHCWASAFLPRVASYLAETGYQPSDLLVAVIIQRQIDAERSGLVFSRDPANRYSSGVIIEAILGAGEDLVSGEATPERYRYSFESKRVTVTRMEGEGVVEGPKAPTIVALEPGAEQRLTDAEVARLAEWGRRAEKLFGGPQDLEWACADDRFWLLQSRPLVFAQQTERLFPQIAEHTVLARGIGVSAAVGAGRVLLLSAHERVPRVGRGTVVVLPRLTNDLAVVLRDAAGVVADEGGATSHGANILREFCVPCVIGAGSATAALRDGVVVTVDGFRGSVYAGDLSMTALEEGSVPDTRMQVFVSVLVPERAAPMAERADGVSSLRDDYFLLDTGVHPGRLVRDGQGEALRAAITAGLERCSALFVDKPVWYKTMDAPTDEFRRLGGGHDEPVERNPLLGWRGIGRSLAEPAMLAIEFEAVARAVEAGCVNLGVKLPFIRFPAEYTAAEAMLRAHGLEPHTDVALGVSVETPAVALGLDSFLDLGADFVSVGLSDLTMCTLALDRESRHVAGLFDPSHPAVLELLERIEASCRAHQTFCLAAGESARDERLLPRLVEFGFDALGVSLSYFADAKRRIAAVEGEIRGQ
jgi:pyruvate,water dikinase